MAHKKPYLINGEYVSKDEYNKNKFDSFLVRVPKGKKEKIKLHAEITDGSLNKFINRAIDEALERDNKRD